MLKSQSNGLRRAGRWAARAAICVFGLVLPTGIPICRGTAASIPPLETGYHDMYDLRFNDASKIFAEWQHTHPKDPMGAASEAASYLFSEFNRLGILRSEFFANKRGYKRLPKSVPDPAVRRAFYNALGKSERLADSNLERDPNDSNALLAKVFDQGLHADYLALIEGRNLSSLRYLKYGGTLADRLLKMDPGCYDAYLAIGVENYLLSLNPAPVRWMLRLYGVEVNKAQGIHDLQLTAEKGHYLLPYARLLLAIAALRDKNQAQAAVLLKGLAQQFPHNPLYAREAARLQ
jgi:hypothetical protein